MKTPLMSGETFETMRLYIVCLTVLYRLLIMPTYLQAYLNIAYDKVAELKQEAGKISNLELQRKVVRVFYYLCVVTLQYTAPMILILYLCFLYKTLGGGSWTGGFTPATFSESGGQAAAAGAELDSEFQEVEVADTRDMDIGIGTIIRQQGRSWTASSRRWRWRTPGTWILVSGQSSSRRSRWRQSNTRDMHIGIGTIIQQEESV